MLKMHQNKNPEYPTTNMTKCKIILHCRTHRMHAFVAYTRKRIRTNKEEMNQSEEEKIVARDENVEYKNQLNERRLHV